MSYKFKVGDRVKTSHGVSGRITRLVPDGTGVEILRDDGLKGLGIDGAWCSNLNGLVLLQAAPVAPRKFRFKSGDRVVYDNGGIFSRNGMKATVIEATPNLRDPDWFYVKWDGEAGAYSCSSDEYFSLLNSSWKEERIRWETSYTKRVVDELGEARLALKLHNYGIERAMDLLAQYHRDLAVPYEQRDAARKENVDLVAENKRLWRLLAANRTDRARTEEQLKAVIAAQQSRIALPDKEISVKDDLKMARSVAAFHDLNGVVRSIDRAIESM